MVACEEIPLYLGIPLAMFLLVASVVFVVGLLLLIAAVSRDWR